MKIMIRRQRGKLKKTRFRGRLKFVMETENSGIKNGEGIEEGVKMYIINLKKTFVLLAVALTVLSLTACSAILQKDNVILKDIAEELNRFLEEDEVLDKAEVLNHEFDKDAGVDIVTIKTESHDESAAYTRFFEASYHLEETKWFYEGLGACDTEQWEQSPLRGVNQEDILADLRKQYVTANGEQWEIQGDCIAELTVLGQDTDLLAGKDALTVSMLIDDVVEQAAGQLELVYTYDKGWQLESCQGGADFITEVKQGKKLEVTEESLIDEILARGLLFGPKVREWGSLAVEQTISMEKGEMSDFAITSNESSYKGKEQIYEFEFNLSKARVDFHIDGMVRYFYGSDGWTMQDMNLIPKLTAVNISGDWYNRYSIPGSRGDAVLSLSETGPDGDVSGVYSFYPDNPLVYDSPGSYEVSGTINMDTLEIYLSAGDWIEKPPYSTLLMEQGIYLLFYVDDARLWGSGHENSGVNAKDLVKVVKDTILLAHDQIEKELLLDMSPITSVLKPEVEALRTPGFDLQQRFVYSGGFNPFSESKPETDQWTYSDYAAALGDYIFYRDDTVEYFGSEVPANGSFLRRFFEYGIFDFDVDAMENFKCVTFEDEKYRETEVTLKYDMSFDYAGERYHALFASEDSAFGGTYRLVEVVRTDEVGALLVRKTEEVKAGMNVKPETPAAPVVVEIPKQEPIIDITAGALPTSADPSVGPVDQTIMGMTMEEKLQIAIDNGLTLEEVYSSPIVPNAY